MGILIIGIIIIQLVWMNNAIRVKNELFDRSVNEALTSTANRLETTQDFRLINHFAFDGADPADFAPPMPPPPPNFRTSGAGLNHHGPESSSKNPKLQMIVHARKSKNGFSDRIETRKDSLTGSEQEILIGTDSLERKLSSAYNKGIHRFDSIVENIESVDDSVPGTKRRFEKKTRLKQVANR